MNGADSGKSKKKRPQLKKVKSSEPSSESDSGSSTRSAGSMIGEFRLLRRLGKGGMAEVWLAEQTSLKRNVALKLLRSDMMGDETYVKRFQTEAKAAAGLNDPNIVQVYTVGFDDGQHFIAQEYIHGNTLKDLIRKLGPLEVPLALHIMKQVASAMATAGDRGIVHRDIKPENIMLTRKKEAKVADFGLAQLQGGERLNLTQEGVTMGTPLYMSPEQVSGQKVDQRTDIYSFGVTCYHMLAGEPPYSGENAVSVAMQHIRGDVPVIEEVRAELPSQLCAILSRMMQKNPDDRYKSANELYSDIRQLSRAIKNGESLDGIGGTQQAKISPVQRPILTVITLGVIVALLSAGLGWYLRIKEPEPNLNAIDQTIPRKATAREQYLHAMFEIDNEDAFRLVIENFKTPQDSLWSQQAHEQLALMYLKDRRRAKDADKILKEMSYFRDNRLNSEARIGQAYLAVRDDPLGGARRASTILQSDRDNFERYLKGSWEQLQNDVQRLIDEKNANES